MGDVPRGARAVPELVGIMPGDALTVFGERFGAARALIGMLHLGALPGTPSASDSVDALIQQTLTEARIYREAGFTALGIENMHKWYGNSEAPR